MTRMFGAAPGVRIRLRPRKPHRFGGKPQQLRKSGRRRKLARRYQPTFDPLSFFDGLFRKLGWKKTKSVEETMGRRLLRLEFLKKHKPEKVRRYQ